MKLSGYTLTRNCISLDYCFEECIQSLIPVCDEVVVSDSESTDGTLEKLKEWERRDSRVRVVQYPWQKPFDDKGWFVKWINNTRGQLRHPMQLELELDADEVLCDSPECHHEIRNACLSNSSRFFDRLNFWRDHRHTVPEGYVCGRFVARLGPTQLYMPSDEPHPSETPNVRDFATKQDALKIFHYGFIRRRDAFLQKSEIVQTAFHGSLDERLKRCRKESLDFVAECPFPQPLWDYAGPHPEVARHWLQERGWQ